MRRTLLLCTLLVAAGAALGTGCSCDSYCDDEAERIRFTGELLAFDGTHHTFAGPDGPIRVGVDGNEEFLDVGDEYRVTAARDVRNDVEWASHVNGGCGCTAVNITHPDGVRIDTSLWARFPIRGLTIAVLAIPVLTLGTVTVLRIVRGRESDDEFLGYDGP